MPSTMNGKAVAVSTSKTGTRTSVAVNDATSRPALRSVAGNTLSTATNRASTTDKAAASRPSARPVAQVILIIICCHCLFVVVGLCGWCVV
jgi:IS4 transposase